MFDQPRSLLNLHNFTLMITFARILSLPPVELADKFLGVAELMYDMAIGGRQLLLNLSRSIATKIIY